MTTPDVPPESDAREGVSVAPPAETKNHTPTVDEATVVAEPAPASNASTDAGALAPSPASKAAHGDAVSKKPKGDPETLEQLIEYAYGRKGQPLALKSKSERPVAQNARLDDEALERLFKIAQSDSLLAVPRQLLLLAQDLAGLPAVKSALRSFVWNVMSRHPAFGNPGVREVLSHSPEGPTPAEALGHILALSPVQVEGEGSLKPGELRELKHNAARLFVTWVATDRNWPADETAALLFEALWQPAAKKLVDDTQRLRALTEAGGAAGVNLSRDDLQDIVGHLVKKGVTRIERLLEREGLSTASVELCLATGGMVNMPMVKSRLDELFGPGRVHVSRRSASAIAEGAAWVAHDKARLHLAKNVELALARNAYMPLLQAGVEMPMERENRRERFDLYCADPSDGYGKFSLVSPHRPGPKVLPTDKRRPLCNMLLKVDREAQPFRERLALEVNVDENLVLTATTWSLNQNSKATAEVHDLEFALATPGARSSWITSGLLGNDGEVRPNEPGDLSMRSNIAAEADDRLVPGEVLYRYKPAYFRVEQEPPQIQVDERLYYEPCVMCGRFSNDPQCACASVMAPQGQGPGVLRA